MKVEATIINPAFKKAVDQLEYDLKHYLYFNPSQTRRNRMDEIVRKHKISLTIRGEMMSQDFDKLLEVSIEWLKANGYDNVNKVYFSADGLIAGIKYGIDHPAIDNCISIYDKDRQKLGEYL